jgi:predicted nucleic acid-binding protein
MEVQVYLIDTNVVSELRKKTKANGGAITFFKAMSSLIVEKYNQTL